MGKNINNLDCALALNGEITSWLVCAPLPSFEKGRDGPFPRVHSTTWGFEHDFLAGLGGEAQACPRRGPMQPGAIRGMPEWEAKFLAAAPSRPDGAVDLRRELAARDWAIAYLFCRLYVPENVRAGFSLCDRADIKIMVNGRIYENFTQERVLRPTARMSFYADLVKGMNNILVKVENRRAPWLFRLQVGLPKLKKGKPFVRLSGAWKEQEVKSLFYPLLADRWKTALDNNAYYGKGQLSLRLPLNFGYPLSLSDQQIVFTLKTRKNTVVQSRAMTLGELMNSPRVVYRTWRRDLPDVFYSAELKIDKLNRFEINLILRNPHGIEECPFNFRKPDMAEIRKAIMALHRDSESFYAGGGVWNSAARQGEYFPPAYRNTANRVVAYCNLAMLEDKPIYRQRAVEGADYLLSEQEGDGSFLWWYKQAETDNDGHPDTHHTLALCGFTGIAMTCAYALTKSTAYLESSERIARWAARFGISSNANYNSLAAEQICLHYRQRPEPGLLKAAIDLTFGGVYPGQLSYGGWAGHNSWSFYHAIIVRGLAVLRSVLPADHFALPELDRRLTAACNHILAIFRGNGSVLSCFDPGEWEASRNPGNPYAGARNLLVDPHVLHALLMVDAHTGLDVKEAVFGLTRALAGISTGKLKRSRSSWATGYDFLCLAEAWRRLMAKR